MELSETGKLVYDRTYARTKPDGTKETWPETVERVVDGNLAFVPSHNVEPGERDRLVEMMGEFKLVPAGRHLWATGAKGAQHLMNCWVSHWTDRPSEHFEFTFLRLMEGGGVGASYSNVHLEPYGPFENDLTTHVVCSPDHPDYAAMRDAGLLSDGYSPDWDGAFVVEDSREGWAAACVDLIDTHYKPAHEVRHKDRVYDVSRVRPQGARLLTFGGTASGPLPLARMLGGVNRVLNSVFYLDGMSAMEIDHALAECVVSGGVRRSARMAMMSWRDPQIERFIACKADSGKHWTTNISVEVDADFWSAVDTDGETGNAARRVLYLMSNGMVRNGEPGFWDSYLSNVGEPNRVVCTNPCGEITLEPWEPCNLGHVNLAAFVDERGQVDYVGLAEAHRLMTRFLIRATFAQVSDPKSRAVLDRNRRVGVGHLGVASMLAMTGARYSEAPHSKGFRQLLRNMAGEVDRAARDYAFELRIPVPVKTRTVAPTGTIAKMPGVSEGIHPIFARHFVRRIRFADNDPAQRVALAELAAEGFKVEPDMYAAMTSVVEIPTEDTLVGETLRRGHPESVVESADELTLDQLLAMQYVYQACWADNAVSFTANVGRDYPVDELAASLRAYGGAIKGATVFPDASMPQVPYERITKYEYEAAKARRVADGVDEACSNGACPIK